MNYRHSIYYIVIFFAMLMTLMSLKAGVFASEQEKAFEPDAQAPPAVLSEHETIAASAPQTQKISNDAPHQAPLAPLHKPKEEAKKAWEGLYLDVMPVFDTLDQASDASKGLAKHAITSLKSFVWQYPDASEAVQAYYLLGRFHIKTGYTAEGRAYLQLLASKYPDSHWTSEALLTLLQSAQDEADKHGIEVFLQSLMKRQPETLAAKASWIYLTLLHMKSGQEKNVSQELSRFEQEDPQFYLKVPAFLDIKARLFVKQGKEAEAREAWMMYLNQVKDQTLKPEILFQIGESLYREGKMLEAENYYNLISLKYSQSKEGALAQVRLAELIRLANERFKSAGVREGKLRPNISAAIQEDAYRRVIEKMPKHYIAPVAYQQFIKLRAEQDRYGDAMDLAQTFDEKFAGNQVAQAEIDFLIDKEISRMETKKNAKDFAGALKIAFDLEKKWGQKPHFKAVLPALDGIFKAFEVATLEEASYKILYQTGLDYLKEKPAGQFAKTMEAMAAEASQKLVKELVKRQDHKKAVEEAYGFLVNFPANKHANEILAIGKSSLAAFDKSLVEDVSDGIAVLNFHYEQPERTTLFTSPEHIYYLARAWQLCWAMDAAMAAFYKAWHEADSVHNKALKNQTIMSWLQASWDADDMPSFDSLLAIASEDVTTQSPEYKTFLDFRLKKAIKEQNWQSVVQSCESIILLLKQPEQIAPYASQLFEAYLALNQWDLADKTLKKHVRSFLPDEQARMLYDLGDAVMLSGENVETAYAAYQMAEKLRPDSQDVMARKALMLLRQGKELEASQMISKIDASDYEIWKKTFTAIANVSEQIKKLEEDIKLLATK